MEEGKIEYEFKKQNIKPIIQAAKINLKGLLSEEKTKLIISYKNKMLKRVQH